MKNITLKRNIEKLGNIIITITGNRQDSASKKTQLPATLIAQAKTLDLPTFIEKLSNYFQNDFDMLEKITTLYLEAFENGMTNEQLIDALSTTQSIDSKNNHGNSNHEQGVIVEIALENNPTEVIHRTDMTITNDVAHINNSITHEEYRKKGLQKIAFDISYGYLANHGITKRTLEAVDLDGNTFNLGKVYESYGFERVGNTNNFVQTIEPMSYMDMGEM